MQVQNLLERWACAVACAVGVVGFAWGTAPTVTVSEFDAATGAFALTLGERTEDVHLFAVFASEDKGATTEGWEIVKHYGVVTADAKTYAGNLPRNMMVNSGKVRFIAVAVSDFPGTRVEYLSTTSTSKPFIDSGVIPDVGTGIRIRAKYGVDMAPFGVFGAFYFFANSGTTVPWGFRGKNGTVNLTAPGTWDGEFHEFDLSSDGVFIDGVKKAEVPTSGTTAAKAPISLFGRYSNDDQPAIAKQGACSIAWAVITENGTPVRDFVTYKAADGKGILYDRVWKLPYESANDATFSFGPEMAPELCDAKEFSASAVQTPSDGLSATVSGVTLSQNATSHRVAVDYTLATAPEGTRAIVTAQVCVDGKPVNGQCLLGDVNLELEAGAHTFYWFPDLDAPGVDMRSVTVNVEAWKTNAPPAYIAFDMRWQAGAITHPPLFFNSTNELVGTIDSDLWRTDYLLMRRINAAGSVFRMGQPGVGAGYEPRYVTFTNDYYIGVFELTQGQFVNCVTNIANPSLNHVKVGDTWRTCPLENISVANFRIGGSGGNNVWPFYGREVGSTLKTKPLAMMRLCTGAMLDMPTEAQWEFACRSGTGTAYHNGTDSLAASDSRNQANPSGNTVQAWTTDKLPTARVDEGGTARVGSFAPSPWGLYDLYGNVWEVCLDQYVGNLSFDQNTLQTPFVEPEGSRTITQMSSVNYVRRGGGWGANTSNGKSFSRESVGSSGANVSTGYRLVCPVPYGKIW